MKKWLLPITLAMALLVPATPSYANVGSMTAVPPWAGCAGGFACFWENNGGTGRLWVAPNCGYHNFPYGDWRNNSFGSAWNRGGGRADLYDSRPPSGSPMERIPVGFQGNLTTANNKTSSMYISCISPG